MASRRAQRQTSFALSVLGHAAIVAALMFSIPLSQPQRSTAPDVVPIDTVMIDQSLVAAEMARIEQAEQDAIRQQEEEQRRVLEAAETLRREQEAEQEAERAEQRRIQLEREEAERVAEAEKIRLQAEQQQEAERLAREAAEREQERQAEIERQRREEERLAAERAAEEERRRVEAAERAKQEQVERELAAALAAEEESRRARESGLLDQYVRSIEDKIKRNWNRPASAGPDVECVLIVTQIPSGEVTGVSIESCNGDSAVVRSIENAVLSASPLPRPPVASLFQRVIRVRFKPDE